MPGPAGQKGHAMSTFPGVALDSPQPIHAAVPELPDAFVGAWINFDAFGAIVAGENDQRVGFLFRARQRCQHLLHSLIDLSDKVTVSSGLTAPFELLQRYHRIMGRGKRE